MNADIFRPTSINGIIKRRYSYSTDILRIQLKRNSTIFSLHYKILG